MAIRFKTTTDLLPALSHTLEPKQEVVNGVSKYTMVFPLGQKKKRNTIERERAAAVRAYEPRAPA